MCSPPGFSHIQSRCQLLQHSQATVKRSRISQINSRAALPLCFIRRDMNISLSKGLGLLEGFAPSARHALYVSSEHIHPIPSPENLLVFRRLTRVGSRIGL